MKEIDRYDPRSGTLLAIEKHSYVMIGGDREMKRLLVKDAVLTQSAAR